MSIPLYEKTMAQMSVQFSYYRDSNAKEIDLFAEMDAMFDKWGVE